MATIGRAITGRTSLSSSASTMHLNQSSDLETLEIIPNPSNSTDRLQLHAPLHGQSHSTCISGSSSAAYPKADLPKGYHIPKQPTRKPSQVSSNGSISAVSRFASKAANGQPGAGSRNNSGMSVPTKNPTVASNPTKRPAPSETNCRSLATEPPLKKSKPEAPSAKMNLMLKDSVAPIAVSSAKSFSSTINASATPPAPAAIAETAGTSLSGSSLSGASASSWSAHAAGAPPLPSPSAAMLVHDVKSANFLLALANAPFDSPLMPTGLKGVLFFSEQQCVLLAQVEAVIRSRIHKSLERYITSSVLNRVRDARRVNTLGDLEGHTLLPLESLLDALPLIETDFTIKF